jgi:heme oxygenase (biliverdin-producing, ferredoxin)
MRGDALRPGLAERLREKTRALHAEAERAGIMRDLMRGRISRSDYCALLANLHAIYTVLEGAMLRHATNPVVARVLFPELARAGSLASDLRALCGERWADDFILCPATRGFVARLGDIERETPELLVAHAYTRYLGDLNGGQILRAIIARALDLGEGGGVSFYDFGAPGTAAAAARRFRDALDALPVDTSGADAIVVEAQEAFARHIRLFEELAEASSAAAASPSR